jgi:hypothetical protein
MMMTRRTTPKKMTVSSAGIAKTLAPTRMAKNARVAAVPAGFPKEDPDDEDEDDEGTAARQHRSWGEFTGRAGTESNLMTPNRSALLNLD